MEYREYAELHLQLEIQLAQAKNSVVQIEKVLRKIESRWGTDQVLEIDAPKESY